MPVVRRFKKVLFDLGLRQSDLDAAFDYETLQPTMAVLEKMGMRFARD